MKKMLMLLGTICLGMFLSGCASTQAEPQKSAKFDMIDANHKGGEEAFK